VSTGARDLAQLALLGEATEHLRDVAVFVWDEDRHYVAVNDEACALVGKSRQELLTMRVGDLSPNQASPHFENVQHGPVHNGSHEIAGADGPIEIDWLTCHTRVGSLPYMVSVVWRKRPA
jgi:PAS domain-containing protein